MDKVPVSPFIDARVLSDLQRLRGRKDLVVKRTSGQYEGGWEFPLLAQVYQSLSGDELRVILTKKPSMFSASVDQKEMDVRELILLNTPQGDSTPTTPKLPVYGINKPVPKTQNPYLMSPSELKAELQYVA
jgi:hypothetical protein